MKSSQRMRLRMVMDQRMRSILISAAENLEARLQSGLITQMNRIKPTITHTGLRIDSVIEVQEGEFPNIFRFDFMLDINVWKDFMANERLLKHGPMLFYDMGIKFVLQEGQDKWDKAGFSIDDGHNGRLDLPLLYRSTSFVVHRDIPYGKEWIIQVEDPAYTSSLSQ